MKNKIKVIPARYLRVAKQKGTIYLQDSQTGRMKGREMTSRGFGDTTKSQYLIKDVDLDKDGKIEDFERRGTIHGRTISVKSSSRSKGYKRRI